MNPEAPWPHLQELASATAQAGWHLLPRLPVYPRYLGLAASSVSQAGGHKQALASNTEKVRILACVRTQSLVIVLPAYTHGVATLFADRSCFLPCPALVQHTSGGPTQAVATHSTHSQSAAQHDDWLDTSHGPRSVRAAVLRGSDSSGLARGEHITAWQGHRHMISQVPMVSHQALSDAIVSMSTTGYYWLPCALPCCRHCAWHCCSNSEHNAESSRFIQEKDAMEVRLLVRPSRSSCVARCPLK